MKCFSNLGGRLLMAGGGDLPESHVAIAKQFSETTFLDISQKALEVAKRKFNQKSEYVNGSILEIQKSEDFFDAAYCAHVIYHIDRELQEKAVREVIRVTRPGGLIVIIYRNPGSLPTRLMHIRSTAKILGLERLVQRSKRNKSATRKRSPLYFFAHPLNWWTRFDNECDVELIPWDVMGNGEEKGILMYNAIARLGYRFCSWFENKYPNKAVQWWSYPVIVLTKKSCK